MPAVYSPNFPGRFSKHADAVGILPGRAAHTAEQDAIAHGFAALASSGWSPTSAEATALADPRFARVYALAEAFVRDALVEFAAGL